jgi:hypothetical protein
VQRLVQAYAQRDGQAGGSLRNREIRTRSASSPRSGLAR